MLTDDELAEMRACQDAALPDTCTLYRPAATADGAGGATVALATLASDVACRVAPIGRSPAERLWAERIAPDMGWTITLPALTDVRADDRIGHNALSYQVLGVLAPGSWETARRVAAVRTAT